MITNIITLKGRQFFCSFSSKSLIQYIIAAFSPTFSLTHGKSLFCQQTDIVLGQICKAYNKSRDRMKHV